ncbi:hypothetical protein Droror1_Dr00009755 [Drosera rotundifolia]
MLKEEQFSLEYANIDEGEVGNELHGDEGSMHGNKETRPSDEEFRSDDEELRSGADHGESILCVRSPSRSRSGSRGRSKDSHGTRSPAKNESKLSMTAVMEKEDGPGPRCGHTLTARGSGIFK